MDSYLKSSAVSRHHYALVHKVENAQSAQEADGAVWAEVDRIRVKVAGGLVDAYEELVVLMYCHTAATVRTISAADLEFALPPAVNLAAMGRTVKHRRIGLTFCAMFMPPDHPLQLMLVNTIRKEIESEEVARIVLAMDFIVACPSEFLAPAVAPRLEALLSHKSQNIRRRAVFVLRALDSISQLSPTDSPRPMDTHLSQHKATVVRRLTRAARENHVRSDEVGAIDALLTATRKLLESDALASNEVIPVIAALLEKTIIRSGKDKRHSQQNQRSPKLVTSLVLTLQCAVTAPGKELLAESVMIDVAKLALRLIRSYAERPGSPQVLQTFRLLGALPIPLVHTLLQSSAQTPQASSSSSPSQSLSKSTARHPVLILRSLLVSRDPTERWAGLACLQALDARLWAGLPLDGAENTIPPVLDEWEVGAIMRGLGDQDKTLRQLTMRVLYGVDPQLLHAYLEQLITPPPSAPSAKQQPGDALEVISFLYTNDGAGFANGLGRILDKDHGKGVDEKLVEGVVSVLHENDQVFRSAFADAMLERITRLPVSLTSPIALGSPSASTGATPIALVTNPTTILLFATTAYDITAGVRQAVDMLLRLLDGKGAGMQEVLLLAALRLIPRLDQDVETQASISRVEAFGQGASLGRHIRRRCELFIRYAKDLNTLRKIVDETSEKPLPEFLQALLSYNPSNAQPTPKQVASPPQSPNPVAGLSIISPSFSTVSLSNSPALRYDAYAPPQPAPRRTRPALQSPFHRESGDSSISGDSPFVREGEDLAGEMVLQAADERRKGKEKARMNESISHLRLDVHGTPKTAAGRDELLPNPNADLITLSALESPFRAETEFGTLNMSNSLVAGVTDPTSDSTTISSPRFHTAPMTSPRLNGSDLAPVDADAIWSSFDVADGDTTLGKQTLRGWCERAPEHVGGMLRDMGVGFVTQKVMVEGGANPGAGQEVFAYIPSPSESPDSEVARAVVRLKPADDGSCLWMLRCGEWELRVKVRKLLDGESG
ncbi:hypothetical protein FS749_005774 [Ceratobasidium sp. UAMH 11750]|nr:hypothetical protein FS749_005774 [Ceratobasidium sp. UAMH 11750]